MPRTGRRTKLTKELQDNIVTFLRGGATFAAACLNAGVAESTAYEWIVRSQREVNGRLPKRIYAEFADAIQRACAERETRLVNQILSIGQGRQVIEEVTVTKPDGSVETRKKYAPANWTAIAWYLERINPMQFGPPQQRIEHGLKSESGGVSSGPSLVIEVAREPAQLPPGSDPGRSPAPEQGSE